MSFLAKRSSIDAASLQGKSAFHSKLTAQERAQVLHLTSLRELPKTRYATQLAITQMPAGRGRKAVFSHIEIYKMVEEIANELRETGVRPGTVCAMVSPTSIEAVVYFLALQWIGAIAAPVDADLSEQDMKTVLKAVRAVTLVSPLVDEDDAEEDEVHMKVTKVAKELDLIHWNIYRSMNKGVQLEQHGRRAGKDAAWRGGAADFKLDPSEVAVYLGSCGSLNDGSPRGGNALTVPLNHTNLSEACKIFAKTYELTPENNATVMTSALSSIHSIVSLGATLYSGGHVVIPGPGEKLTGETFLTLAKENKVSWVSGNPEFVEELNAEAGKSESSMNGVNLRFVRCHDGFASQEALESFEENTKTPLLEAYGTAETAGIGATNTVKDRKVGTAGKSQYGTVLAVFDPETKKKLGPGKSGDIGICGRVAMAGYLDNDKANESSCVKVEEEDGSTSVFVLTGNRGTVDADGFLVIDGDSREIRVAEEEVRSQRMLASAEKEAEMDKIRAQEEIGREKKEAANAAEAARLAEIAAAKKAEDEKKRTADDAANAKKRADDEAAKEAKEMDERTLRERREAAEAVNNSSSSDDETDGKKAAIAVGGLGAGVMGARAFNREDDKKADKESMAQILERLMSIETNQKTMEAELKAKHAAEMAEMQLLLEETKRGNASEAERALQTPVLNFNMDEVNAAVTAASLAAQDSSRHTAEAAEAARRAAAIAEEASKQPPQVIAAPLDLNASRIEVNDPNNVQKTITVSLDDVEEAMNAHPAVGTCRAFGRPDPRFGAEVYCCIFPKKGARISEPWLKLHAQSVLPAAFVPKKFFYRDDLSASTERAELSKDENLKRISHLSGYSTTKMVKSPTWNPEADKKAAA